jgi:hypothetical protein
MRSDYNLIIYIIAGVILAQFMVGIIWLAIKIRKKSNLFSIGLRFSNNFASNLGSV